MEYPEAFPFLVDGSWRTSPEPRTIRFPLDGREVARVHRADAGDLEDALAAAARAHPLSPELPTHRRAAILRQVSGRIEREAAPLARMIALEAGKPLALARAEVARAAATFALAAEEAARIEGEVLPLDLAAGMEGRTAVVRRFPIGPVVAITPFNFPLNLVAHKLAPALAAGCPVVLKPASQTPLSALTLARYLVEAGAPPGALSVLPCAASLAERLVTDPRPRMLTFTGSGEVGWALKARAGRKRVALELGGNAGVLVLADADLDLAARKCAAGGFGYAGQSCISVQRILVHRDVAEEFEGRLGEAVRGLKVGDPLDESVTVGPMITEADARRAEAWIREAMDGGARLLIGGRREGSVLYPTVLADVAPEMKVSCREVFAPVVALTTVGSVREGINRLNDSDYGLQGGIFTRDLEAVLSAWRDVEVGGLMVNEVPTFRLDAMPYGGVKASGTGREGPRYAIRAMTEPRLLVLNHLGAHDPG